MSQLDFFKVEQTIGNALHHQLFVKKLSRGEAVSFARAVLFFGYHVPKPSPQDSVIQALVDMQFEFEEEEEELEPTGEDTMEHRPKRKMPPNAVAPPEVVAPEPISFAEDVTRINPLLILRNRILWLIRKKVANVYRLIGSTKEEMVALRKKQPLTDDDIKRINELINKSNEVTQRTKKRIGAETDDALIETEKKKHRTKRFNVRESWLAL